MDLYEYSPSYQMTLLEEYIYCYSLETKCWVESETLGFGLHLGANRLGGHKNIVPLDCPPCEECGALVIPRDSETKPGCPTVS